MPSFVEKVSIWTQAVRTLLAAVVVGLVGAAGWYGYQLVDSSGRMERALVDAREQLQLKEEQLSSLQAEVDRQQEVIDRLETAMRLLKVDHRVARLHVRSQTTDEDTGRVTSLVEFQELDQQGLPIEDAKVFEIPGDVIYVDSWIVKFEDKYVERADIHRSTSLVLFQRIFGNDQRPSDGFALDEVGMRPGIYGAGSQVSEWEQQIWSDFWSVANNKARQEELGIRAAHGEAPSIKVEPGKTYRITLRASAGLDVSLDENAPPRRPKPEA